MNISISNTSISLPLLKKIENKKYILLFFILGFVSGIPFLLTLSTLSVRLVEVGVQPAILGLYAVIGLPYSLKFLWAPFIDYYRLPFFPTFLSQKYSWAIASNLLLAIGIISLGLITPTENSLLWLAFFGFWVTFFAATQDVIIDTLRIQFIPPDLAGIGAALETSGFRLGMLASGLGTILLSEYFSWLFAHIIMAALVMTAGLSFLILNYCTITDQLPQQKLINSPDSSTNDSKAELPIILSENTPPSSFKSIFRNKVFHLYFNSFQDLIKQPYFYSLLLFIFCFKAADITLNSMMVSFLDKLGFTKLEYANIAKLYGTTMMLLGNLPAGYLIYKHGVTIVVKLYAVLQLLAVGMFFIQIEMGHSVFFLSISVGMEGLASGVGATALMAYINLFCQPPSTASHFTLLYSFGSFYRLIISGAAGFIAQYYGWEVLFSLAALLTLPIFYYLRNIEKIRLL